MAKKSKHLKVLGSLSGLFGFSFYPGQIVEIGPDVDEKQAEEIVSVRLGEYTDSKTEDKPTPKAKTPAEQKADEKALEAAKAAAAKGVVPGELTANPEAQAEAFTTLKAEADGLKVEYTDATTFDELTALVAEAKTKQ